MTADDANELVQRVGRRAAEIRRLSGSTQEEIAERLGVSLKYIQRIEAGRENLSLRSLARLGATLGVEVEELFVEPHAPRRTGRPAGQDEGLRLANPVKRKRPR